MVDGMRYTFTVGLPGGRFYFVARKHDDWIKFAVDDELEWSVWVQTLCRATGQMHQPRPSAALPVPSCRPSQAARGNMN